MLQSSCQRLLVPRACWCTGLQPGQVEQLWGPPPALYCTPAVHPWPTTHHPVPLQPAPSTPSHSNYAQPTPTSLPLHAPPTSCAGTVEDRMLQLQDKKREMVAAAFGEAAGGSGGDGVGGGGGGRLSMQELMFLFGAGGDRPGPDPGPAGGTGALPGNAAAGGGVPSGGHAGGPAGA